MEEPEMSQEEIEVHKKRLGLWPYMDRAQDMHVAPEPEEVEKDTRPFRDGKRVDRTPSGPNAVPNRGTRRRLKGSINRRTMTDTNRYDSRQTVFLGGDKGNLTPERPNAAAELHRGLGGKGVDVAEAILTSWRAQVTPAVLKAKEKNRARNKAARRARRAR